MTIPRSTNPFRYFNSSPEVRAMIRFRRMKTLQKFSAVHAQVHNHFKQQRHLVDRQTYKQRRSA